VEADLIDFVCIILLDTFLTRTHHPNFEIISNSFVKCFGKGEFWFHNKRLKWQCSIWLSA